MGLVASMRQGNGLETLLIGIMKSIGLKVLNISHPTNAKGWRIKRYLSAGNKSLQRLNILGPKRDKYFEKLPKIKAQTSYSEIVDNFEKAVKT